MKKAKGFTLIELMVTITVAAILLAIAAPSFRDLVEKRRLIGAAEHVFQQLMFARTEAIKRSKPLIVDFSANNTTTWHFGITDSDALDSDPNAGACDSTVTDPAAADACTVEYDNDPNNQCPDCGITPGDPADPFLMTFDNTDFEDIRMRGRDTYTAPYFGTANNPCNSTEKSETCFDPQLGTARNGRVVLCTDDTYELHVVVGGIGRARMCSPANFDSPRASCSHTQDNYRKVPGYPSC